MSEHAPLSPPTAYWTPEQVGELLQLSTKTIYRLASSDPSMPMLKLGGSIRFPQARLERWLRDQEQGRPRPRMVRQVRSVGNPVSGKAPVNA